MTTDNLCACEFRTCHPLVNTMASGWRLVGESSSPLQLKMTFCQVPHEPKPTHCHATIQPQLTATCMYVSNHCRTSPLDFTGLAIHAFVREYHVDIYIYTHIFIHYHLSYPTPNFFPKECKHPRSLIALSKTPPFIGVLRSSLVSLQQEVNQRCPPCAWSPYPSSSQQR